MNKNSLRLLSATVGLSAVFAVTACSGGGGTPDESRDGQVLKMGMIDSLTGLSADAGGANACGAQIAVEAINAGEVADTGELTVELTIEDDQSTPAVAASAAADLTGQGLQIFVGGLTSSNVLAAMPVLGDVGALHMGGTTKAAEFLTSATNVVRINSGSVDDSQAVIDHLTDEGVESVEIVAAQGVFGENAAKQIREGVPSSISTDEIIVAADQTNFDAVVSTLTSKKPDAVVFILFNTGQQIAFMRAMQTAGLDATIVAYPGNLTGAHLDGAGGATDGVQTLDIYSVALDNEANTTFVESFDKYASDIGDCAGRSPERQSALTYSQVVLAAQGAAAAESTDPAVIRQTLLENEWNLPQGTVTFDESGQAKSAYTVLVGEDVDDAPGLVVAGQ